VTTAVRAHDGFLAHDLRVQYPGRRTPALDGVSVIVDPGERVGIAGRTGAGKSTLALVAAGFIPRVVRARLQGSASACGLDLAAASPRDLLGTVGIVFATPANQLSASKLTVREELAFGLENLGVPRPDMDPRIDAVLDRLGIAGLADREPFSLSGGEQQRVAIASVVAMGGRLLALDEPTAQLDPAGTEAVADLLRELAGGGTAILCVEHDPVMLGSFDRCVVLDRAVVAGEGVPGEALGSSVLGPIGLASPTNVRLSEAAGLPAAAAFDEEALSHAVANTRSPLDSARSTIVAPIEWHSLTSTPAGAIRIESLTHRYPAGQEAVRGVTLRIEAGSGVAIVGQNGSGKTTLVKHLNGLLRPSQGDVRIGDQDTGNVPVHRLAQTVGFVFQNPDDQLFNRDVEREVAFGPRNIGLPEPDIARLVGQALDVVGLSESRTSNPYDLGISERKLVALASVLAMDTPVLVLDEPTTGQDGPGIARVGAIVDGLRAAGRTVIAITHDMEFAARHFGRIVVMRQGSVVADGPPEVVFAPGNEELLASTGLRPPLAARIGARLGLGATPTEAALLAALRARPPGPEPGPAR
jgi:energy-coupling factor transport system ATP-binding protein